MTFGENVLKFYHDLSIREALPPGIAVMNPYQDKTCFEICREFYGKYYNDHNKRYLILGINPGRYGAGLTGIPFTDPIKLESVFGIKNSFSKKPELSADFIHTMIAAFGGYETFFSKFFINSVSPLGFVKEGKNLNYYDTPALRNTLESFIIESIRTQLDFPVHRHAAFCLGEGENYKYLQKINEQEKFFGRIIPLAHPRFIMQYKRRHVDAYIHDYLKKFQAIAQHP
ncbi:MAG: uracil-DNA glycosylase family protein [Chryseosolibacter sp.]